MSLGERTAMATAEFKRFKPKRGNKTNFWVNLGIENVKTALADVKLKV
ncbi:hypothetical protein VINE108521_07685 [Vibrio neonatus]